MEHIIQSTLNEFSRITGANITFSVHKNGKEGYIKTKNNKFNFLFRAEVRIKDVNLWKDHFCDNNIVLIARKIYANAKDELIKQGISFFEHEGSFSFECDGKIYSRDKVNSYDQRTNLTRLNGKFGSRVLSAVMEDNNLLDQDITETAARLNMGVSTLYYYFSEIRQQRILTRINSPDEYPGYKDRLLDFTYQNIYIRNFDSTLIGNMSFRPEHISCISSLQGISKTYMAWDGVPAKQDSMLTGYDGQYHVLTNPYNSGCCSMLRQNFRKGFSEWSNNRVQLLY